MDSNLRVVLIALTNIIVIYLPQAWPDIGSDN